MVYQVIWKFKESVTKEGYNLYSWASQVIFSPRSFEICLYKTQNPVLCRQKEFVFSLGLFNQEKGDSALIGHKSN